MLSFPYFSGGNTELTAAHLNAITEQLRRAGQIRVAPPLEVIPQAEGWMIRLQMPSEGFWGKIGDHYGGGSYSWLKQNLGVDGFEDDDDTGLYGNTGRPALEMNQSPHVQAGDIVWIFPEPASIGSATWRFFAPRDADVKDRAVFWARLTEESAGSYGYVEVVLDNGVFRDQEEEGRRAAAGETAAAVEASGTTGIAAGTYVLLYEADDGDSDGGEELFSDADAARKLVFSHASGSSGFWIRLIRPAAEDGGDLPFGDGSGRYAWVPLTYDDAGSLVESEDAAHSHWPLSLAYESNRRGDCPEGLAVWVRSTGSRVVSRTTAEADPAFAAWSADDVADYLDAFNDSSGEGLSDSPVSFTLWGEHSFWGRIVGTSDGAGTYDFESVKLGSLGREPPTLTDDILEGRDQSFADALTAQLLPGSGLFYDAAAAESATDENGEPLDRGGWSADGKLSGIAREVNRRNDVGAGAVVRIYPRYDAVAQGIVWEFEGALSGFWVRISGGGTAGVYAWQELFPAVDLASAIHNTPRSGTAREASGSTTVPVDAEVWLEPDNAGTPGYFFRHGSAPGAEVTLIRYTGAGTGTVDANPTAPSLHSGNVSVITWPTQAPNVLKVGSYYVGFRVGTTSSYVVCLPLEYANDRRGGLISASDQILPNYWKFKRRLYFGSGTATGGVARSRFLRFHYPTSLFALKTQGQSAFLDNAGSPEMQQSDGVGCRIDGTAFTFTGDCYSVYGTGQVRPRSSVYDKQWYDGITGSLTVQIQPGLTRTLVFVGGLFVSSTDIGTATPLFSGTFRMDNGDDACEIPGTPSPFSSCKLTTVTVVNGVITQVVADP